MYRTGNGLCVRHDRRLIVGTCQAAAFLTIGTTLIVLSPSSTRIVCADAIPKSLPTKRLELMCRLFGCPSLPARSRSDVSRSATVPRTPPNPRLPLMCCKRARPQPGRPTSLMRGIRGRVRCDDQIDEAKPTRGLPQCASQRHHPNQPGRQCNPGTPNPRWIPGAGVAYMCDQLRTEFAFAGLSHIDARRWACASLGAAGACS